MKEDLKPLFDWCIGIALGALLVMLITMFVAVACQTDYVPMNSKHIVNPDTARVRFPVKEEMP